MQSIIHNYRLPLVIYNGTSRPSILATTLSIFNATSHPSIYCNIPHVYGTDWAEIANTLICLNYPHPEEKGPKPPSNQRGAEQFLVQTAGVRQPCSLLFTYTRHQSIFFFFKPGLMLHRVWKHFKLIAQNLTSLLALHRPGASIGNSSCR